MPTQHLPGGAVASQEAIKELGTNGGGPYNANSAHPFENPNAFTNLLEIVLLLLIPFALPRTFGKMLGDKRQGWAILAAMAVIFAASLALVTTFEAHHSGAALQAAGAAMEGKEVRFGVPSSALFANATTLTSTGAVNSMHDSFTPLGGGVPILNMMFGEIAPGGTGSGLYGILVLAVITVFVAGPDGRPNAGVPRQEDPGAGGEVRRALHPDHARRRPDRHRGRDVDPVGAGLDAERRVRTASPRCSTRSPRPATTTAARSPG